MNKIALALLFVSLNTMAGEIKNLYFSVNNEASKCSMMEFGSAAIANPIILKGEHLGYDHCVVHLTADEFSKQFDICALGGIQSLHPESPIECKVRYSKNGWVEFSQKGSNDCEFVCKTK